LLGSGFFYAFSSGHGAFLFGQNRKLGQPVEVALDADVEVEPLAALEKRGNPWGKMEKKRADWIKDKTFAAITHARTRIQSFLAEALESKFCPVLRFHVDEQFRKTLDVMRLIDEVAGERRQREGAEDEDQEQE